MVDDNNVWRFGVRISHSLAHTHSGPLPDTNIVSLWACCRRGCRCCCRCNRWMFCVDVSAIIKLLYNFMCLNHITRRHIITANRHSTPTRSTAPNATRAVGGMSEHVAHIRYILRKTTVSHLFLITFHA